LWSPPDKAGRRERLHAGALQVLLCAERGAFVGTDRREHQALAEAKHQPLRDPILRAVLVDGPALWSDQS
jgi:hypothetical protein